MVFVNEEWNNTGDIVVYSNYHKYWLDRERKIKNPFIHGKWMKRTLKLKGSGIISIVQLMRMD